MNKILKWGIISLCIGTLIFVGYLVWGFMAFVSSFDQSYNKEDLIENYKIKSEEINELQRYMKSIIPNDKSLTLEFESNSSLSIFHLSDKNGDSRNWDINVNSKKTDSLLRVLDWTNETLMTIKEKLDRANCISVENKDPFTVGYQRSGLGMYFYNLFDKPMTDSLKKEYNDGCLHLLYSDKVALEFSGGAVGQQCFEDFKRSN
jgi:hypothetical protein